MRQVTLARRRYRHVVAVEISDNGPGIPEELRERVFHPLVSGREGGSGLGLTLAQNFVNQHHGVISFESAPGSTCFTILLPAERRRAMAQMKPVWIIDDDRSIRWVFEKALDAREHRVQDLLLRAARRSRSSTPRRRRSW